MLMFSLRVPRANPFSMARLAHVHHVTSVHLLRIVNMHCAELCLKLFTRPPALGVQASLARNPIDVCSGFWGAAWFSLLTDSAWCTCVL